MSQETIALASYAWTKRRKATTVVIGLAALGELIALASILLPQGIVSQTTVMTVLGLCVAPSLLYALMLFDFSKSTVLDQSSGSYDPWLLRLPMATWKLALIPAGLLTIWITFFWAIVVVSFRWIGGVELPFFQQAIAMCGVAIFFCSLTWRPQRRHWLRLIALIISLPLLYGMSIAAIAIEFEAPQWTPITYVVAVILYVAANAFAWQSVALARVSAYQQHPLESAAATRNDLSTAAVPVTSATATSLIPSMSFSSESEALRWHDLARSRVIRWQVAATFLVPMMLIVAMLLPLTAATAWFALFMAGAVSLGVIANLVEPAVWSNSSSLPTYLLVSPLRADTIAWNRLLTIGFQFVRFYVLATLIGLVALAWQSNREIAVQWWDSQWDRPFVAAPLRIVVAAYLGSLVASLGVCIRESCLMMYGQQKPIIAATLACFLIALIPSGLFLSWFLDQTDWDVVKATMLVWLSRTVYIVMAALSLKLCLAVVASVIARRRQLIPETKLMGIGLGWLVVVLIAATGLWMLWPSASMSYPLTLLGTAIVIPLTPWLLAPVAVDSNRHRGN